MAGFLHAWSQRLLDQAMDASGQQPFGRGTVVHRGGGDDHHIHTRLDQGVHFSMALATVLLHHLGAAVRVAVNHAHQLDALHLRPEPHMVAAHATGPDHAVTKGSRGGLHPGRIVAGVNPA